MCKGRIGASLVSGEWSECVNTNAHMKGEAGKFMKIAVHAAHTLSCVSCVHKEASHIHTHQTFKQGAYGVSLEEIL